MIELHLPDLPKVTEQVQIPERRPLQMPVVDGPGFSTDVPATFMYTYAFTRGQIGLGSASSMMMLLAVVAIIVPYLYSELRSKPDEQ